ncbi:SRPBCC family protein [Brachybacterium saurashtrense]|uniref:SRPBCC domain-containing protein n=1 Tax=Brachybacterium saurashtrense TaxID=556288 RepID=A0A345YR56_9MICO|nr:SRPBCC domain-containing protein [Brachybacterium saurashtrense]AXK46408.1 SRPBCC domain-containing protein [Brachybacterium saurashtrense]RRR24149.1 SRPBCC domain-containing protein [Brachybacterium saurashtrense]
MPVTDISHDLDSLTLTITARFAAPVERIWQIYADPRQLERVWGPKEYPATVVDHSLTPGGLVTYYMTGPEGDRHHGYWKVLAVDEPHSFTYEDGFAHEDFTPNTDLPISTCVATLTADGDGTLARYVTTYADREGLQTVLEMGVEEGTRSAMSQIDELIA